MVLASVSKQPVERVPTRQANSLHPPRTKDQPQACSIGRRSLTAPVQSKEEGGGSLCQQAARASASQTGKQCVHPPRTEDQPQACS